MEDNDLGFRTSEYDYWDDYKNWLRQLEEDIKCNGKGAVKC